MTLIFAFLSAFMYAAGLCKTMTDYEITGLKMWVILMLWPVVYVFWMAQTLLEARSS